ncbi:MAG: helix-turn-helix domain-containing protein [Clostridiales Family XIII bacterium]|jgi:transcriptional regulator with XRE-family HTH domain|nr:helix-turn-helix domain-containing protein [Clostridiales Family XIII bacterium]
MAIGRNIKKIRLLRGFSQRELAKKSDMKEQQLQAYELGIQLPKEKVLSKIASALKVEALFLIDPLTIRDKFSGNNGTKMLSVFMKLSEMQKLKFDYDDDGVTANITLDFSSDENFKQLLLLWVMETYKFKKSLLEYADIKKKEDREILYEIRKADLTNLTHKEKNKRWSNAVKSKEWKQLKNEFKENKIFLIPPEDDYYLQKMYKEDEELSEDFNKNYIFNDIKKVKNIVKKLKQK